MSTALGKLETQLVAYAHMRRTATVSSEEVSAALSLSATQTRDLLSRLARRNLIARVRRGLYLIPPRIPPGGRWSPDEFLALSTLINDRNGRYQICGPSAFYRYGWSDQVPNRSYAYNNVFSGQRTIGSVTLELIKVDDTRLGDTETFTTPDGIEPIYSSRIRTLVDAVYDWSRFGSLPHAYTWIRNELAQDSNRAKSLVATLLKFGNKSTQRRLGKLLELEGVDESLLKKIERRLPSTSARIPWCPTRAKRGRVDDRWGVIFNE